MTQTVRLHSHTAANPVIFESVPYLFQGLADFPDRLAEYAGRLCYRSDANMGHSPDFIAGRIAAGHEDIIEHAVITVSGVPLDSAVVWKLQSPHLHLGTGIHFNIGASTIPVTGNARAWRLLFTNYLLVRSGLPDERRQEIDQAIIACATSAPQIFAGIVQQLGEPISANLPDTDNNWLDTSIPPVTDGQMTVTLLGANLTNYGFFEEGKSATFLFEGISRSCTHQLVRHRLASFSQESQRYVDLEKGDWAAIVPPAIAGSSAAQYAYAGAIEQATAAYRALRALGIRKEDARFLLPNAMETRIVVTMNFPAWTHFFRLRALDKAAQWEIRRMAQHALRMLATLSPIHFAHMAEELS